jgi:hypothetical protein
MKQIKLLIALVVFATFNSTAQGVPDTPVCATVTATVSSQTDVTCSGDATGAATITASGGTSFTYNWQGTTGSIATVTGLAAGSYTCTIINQCGNSTTQTVSISALHSLPTVTANSSAPQTVCSGSEIALYGSGASSYTWSDSINDGGLFEATNSKTYTVTGTDDNGCSDTASIAITVIPFSLPDPIITASATTICSGDAVTVSATDDGARSIDVIYGRRNVNGTPVHPEITGLFLIRVYDANNCYKNFTKTITVNKLPSIKASASETTVCSGSSITLTGSGSGAYSYAWSDGITDGLAFAATTSKTYTVTGTDTNGCSNTASIAITLNKFKVPNVAIAASAATVCSGSTVKLTASGAKTYVWSDSTVKSGVSFIPSATKTYTLIGTDINNCSKTVVKTVTVNELPTVTASASASTVCSGTAVTLTAIGANTYNWSLGVQNAVEFIHYDTHTYTVTGTAANKCTNTATVKVTRNKLPNVAISASADNVCPGRAVTLNHSGAKTYTWSDSVIIGVAFTPTATKTYTLTGTDTNNCSKTVIKTIKVKERPEVSATTSAEFVCEGNAVTLTAIGARSYSWSDGVKNGVAFIPKSKKTYVVIGTSPNGCKDTAYVGVPVVKNTLKIVTASASSSSVCPGTTIKLTGSGADFYTWAGAGAEAIKNNEGSDIEVIVNATETFTVTGSDKSCYKTAVTTITVDSLYCKAKKPTLRSTSTAINDIDTAFSELSIYPNPFAYQTTISFSEEQTNTTINVIDVLGNVVKTIAFTGKQYVLEKGELSAGTYFLRIIDVNKNVVNKKIIIR